jgi:hypothetical protein
MLFLQLILEDLQIGAETENPVPMWRKFLPQPDG